MSSQDIDCVVIGAGVHGSFTAYHLAKNGVRTLLLEQVCNACGYGSTCARWQLMASSPLSV